MKNLLKIATIAGAMLAGSAAQAVEHEVIILRYGYFPETIYVSTGDTIKFINGSPNWAYIVSHDAYDNYSNYEGDCDTSTFAGSQDGWSTPWIYIGGTHTVTVTACMEDQMLRPEIWNYYEYDNYNNGWINYGSAPTGS